MDALDETSITTAIQNQVSEAVDLDWKSAHYRATDRDRFELAKDVAQLANTFGGIIVLGVAEVNGVASASTPVELGDHNHRRMNQILSNWIQPFLVGVRYIPIETQPGEGFLIIVVPQSVDAPHAVLRRDLNLPVATVYPVRDGTNTRYLSEYEIAVRYRDRYQSRTATKERLGGVHDEGVSRIQLYGSPWLTVSLVPVIPGNRGLGSEALKAESQFLDYWAERYGCNPDSLFSAWQPRIVPGIRRAIITEMQEYAGTSKHPHAELHYDGSGFAASNRIFETADSADTGLPRTGSAPSFDRIAQDAVELQIMFAVSLLAHHATSTGASGECFLRAQQTLRQQTDPGKTITAGEIHEPVTPYAMGVGPTNYRKVDSSVRIEHRQTLWTDSSASLDELVSDIHAVVRTSYGLAADILGEFAVTEPIVLQADGYLNIQRLHTPSRRSSIEPWATQYGLSR